MATKEKNTSQTKQPAKHAVKGQVVESKVVDGKVVQGKVVDNEASAPRNAQTARPTDLHPQTLQRLDPLTKTYQTAGMRAEEARQRALNELRDAQSRGELP